jgi:hypothetical protein
MVENTHQKYEKNQNKTSVAKSMGPFRDSQAPFWLSVPRTDVATEPPLVYRHWLWREQLFMRCFVIPQALRS